MGQSWFSTDQGEVEKRQLRGKTEKMKVRAIDRDHLPFSTYRVSTESSVYRVELRSFRLLCNSCDCPDFQTNGLGTCKHIEGVIHRARGKRRRSPFVDIYLSLLDQPRISVQWPDHSSLLPELQKLLSPYFSSNGQLLTTDLSAGVCAIQNAIKRADPSLSSYVRISAHLIEWIEEEELRKGRRLSREQFLADVRAGKRTLQMLSTPLYPYQEEGMAHLAFQERAILADEMGLGKTIQAIAAAELLRRLHQIQRVVVICPTSLKGEWEEQITRFTPLSQQIISGERSHRLAAYRTPSFFNIVNYEQVRSDVEEIQELLAPDLIILDEAQRIKNWNTQTAAAVKKLRTPFIFVLTGTPIENRIDDIYSIMQVVNPRIFGPLFKFNRRFYKLDEKGKPIGYKELEGLHSSLHPLLLRRLKRDVESQLPERTVNHYFVEMTPEQGKRYEEYSERVAKLVSTLKRRPLNEEEFKKLQQWLACMRMVVDTPFILDSECRDCPKLIELEEILTELLQNPDNKIIIFSEWERMLFLVKELLESKKISFAWHTGTVPQDKRREEIRRFKEDPSCLCFLSTDAGSTGLNLQVANTVINLDLPWNPAKLEQRIARAWRKHQTRAVQVINLVCKESIEYRMLATLAQKEQLAVAVLEGGMESDEIDLVSGKAALLERLSLLLNERGSLLTEASTPYDAMIAVKNDLLARFTDRVHHLQFYEGSPPTLVAVVDLSNPETRSQMDELLLHNFPHAPPDLILFDKATFALVQRLSKSGILNFRGEGSHTLYQSPDYGEGQALEKERQLESAKESLAAAERKMSISLLLASGHFFAEALPPAAEALDLGIKSLSCMKIGPQQEWLHLQSQMAQLDGSDRVEPLLQSVKESLEEIAQRLTQFSLR